MSKGKFRELLFDINENELTECDEYENPIDQEDEFLLDTEELIQKEIEYDGIEDELKIFMTASEQIRAERRFKELQQKGENVSFEEVLKNVQHRDYLDTTRKESPLVKANDAIEIDNSFMTIDEQVNKIVALATAKG